MLSYRPKGKHFHLKKKRCSGWFIIITLSHSQLIKYQSGSSGATSAVQPRLSLTADYTDFTEGWVGASRVTDTEVTADWISHHVFRFNLRWRFDKVTVWVSSDDQVSTSLSFCPSTLRSEVLQLPETQPETDRLQQVYRRVPESEARESHPSIFSSIHSPERENGTGEERGGGEGQKMEEEKRRGSLFLH